MRKNVQRFASSLAAAMVFTIQHLASFCIAKAPPVYSPFILIITHQPRGEHISGLNENFKIV
jgi:hypothetical protein